MNISIPITIRNGGIFPEYPNESEAAHRNTRTAELRSRARLAWGFTNDILKPVIRLEKDCQLVLLTDEDSFFSQDELRWSATRDMNTGLIKVAYDPTLPINEHPCRLFLFADRHVNIDATLRVYFTASLRWLSDGKNYTIAHIEKSFEKAS